MCLQEIVGDLLELAKVSKGEKDLEIILEYQEDVPPNLEGDSARLRQVLLNLVMNAVKFSTQGEIRIRIGLREKSLTEAKILFEIIDSGIGISETARKRLFLPFSQADESTSRKYGGSGLGLAISKQIVQAQGGEIDVVSQPGEGSTFWFELPFKLGPLKDDCVDHAPQSTPDAASLSKIRILLAEDDPVNQVVAATQLETMGLKPDVVKNGHEALEALDNDSYSLVFMDCQMPELDGFETSRIIRERGYTHADLPIIALTAHAFDEDRKRCREAGMDDFLSKPVLLEDLRATLATWLKQDVEFV